MGYISQLLLCNTFGEVEWFIQIHNSRLGFTVNFRVPPRPVFSLCFSHWHFVIVTALSHNRYSQQFSYSSPSIFLLGKLEHLFFWPVKASTFSSINLWETKVPKTLQVRFEGYMGKIKVYLLWDKTQRYLPITQRIVFIYSSFWLKGG